MAEIIEKIGKVLQEQAIPAAQRFQSILSNDGKIFDQIRPELHNNELYGDIEEKTGI